MPFALHTDYALRTLMFLASHPGQRRQVADVARFYSISRPHVAKVVNRLSRLGYIRSIRGIGGGIELARPPDQVNIADVVRSFEGSLHLLECIGTDDVCVIQPWCKLRNVLARAEQVQLDYLGTVKLSDVIPV